MPKVVILADDMTGANDAGLQFAKRGFRTISLLDAADTDHAEGADVLVINGETRSLDADSAYRTIVEISNKLPGNSLIFKKIDSTMRGNIGAELNALMDSGEFELAAVIPAYPANGRTTIGGYHFLNHILLEESEIARDPKSPVDESHLPTYLARQTNREIGHVELRVIRKQPSGILGMLHQLKCQGKRIVVFDSASQQDLKTITAILLHSGLRLLWVGSAGLAQSLAEVLSCSENMPKRTEDDIEPSRATMVIAGSVSVTTHQQIQALQKRPEFHIISANPLSLLDGTRRDNAVTELIRQVIAVIDAGQCPVLITETSESARSEVEKWVQKNGITPVAAGNCIADCLGRIGAAVLAKRKLRGFVLTGGDTAYHTCLHLRVKALRIVNEVEEGVPLCIVMGGCADKLPVVTKAGAFGHEDSLVRAVEKIQTFKGVYI